MICSAYSCIHASMAVHHKRRAHVAMGQQTACQSIRAHTHTRTRTHTHTHTHTQTNTHARTRAHTRTHAHTCTHTHTGTHARTRTHTHTHTHARTHTCAHTHIHTHACTHAHTHARTLHAEDLPAQVRAGSLIQLVARAGSAQVSNSWEPPTHDLPGLQVHQWH